MNCEKVSLIIPVYNVERFLTKCLESVAAQTYKNLEVIIVNDGSRDGSLDIIKSFAEKNSNFKYYTIENQGQGMARNIGIRHSSGKYISFLDSDDYIAEDFIEKMVDAIETENADIAICNNFDVKEDGTVIAESKNSYKNNVTNIYSEPQILFNRVCPWGKLYKKELFNNLEFVSRIWYEDMRLIPKLYIKAKKIVYIDHSLVFYVQRKGSTMNNSNSERNLEIIEVFEDLISYYKTEKKYEQFKNELDFLVLDHIAVSTVTRVILSGSKNKNYIIKKLFDYLNRFESIYSNPYIKTMSTNRKIILWLNRHKFYLLTEILMKLKHTF